jgi:hypothetical protein
MATQTPSLTIKAIAMAGEQNLSMSLEFGSLLGRVVYLHWGEEQQYSGSRLNRIQYQQSRESLFQAAPNESLLNRPTSKGNRCL